VHITISSESTEQLRRDWERMLPGVPLIVIETPFRSLVTPFLHYLDVMAPTPPDTITIVVLPEYVPRHRWDRFLHDPKAQRIRQALIGGTTGGGALWCRARRPKRSALRLLGWGWQGPRPPFRGGGGRLRRCPPDPPSTQSSAPSLVSAVVPSTARW
jgi:hypothetical protein